MVPPASGGDDRHRACGAGYRRGRHDRHAAHVRQCAEHAASQRDHHTRVDQPNPGPVGHDTESGAGEQWAVVDLVGHRHAVIDIDVDIDDHPGAVDNDDNHTSPYDDELSADD